MLRYMPFDSQKTNTGSYSYPLSFYTSFYSSLRGSSALSRRLLHPYDCHRQLKPVTVRRELFFIVVCILPGDGERRPPSLLQLDPTTGLRLLRVVEFSEEAGVTAMERGCVWSIFFFCG